MNIFSISWKNFKNKGLTNSLSVLLLALGVGIISLILIVGKQLDDKFTKNIKGIDMVVGAKGSPLQLILSSIYQIDAPTGNISLSEANTLSKNPFIKSAIPISMGDSYLGYRIVGTNDKYIAQYQGNIEKGAVFKKPMDCILGAIVAQTLNLKVGDSFASAHGLDNEGDKHEKAKYNVAGILAYNNSVIDQLIITPLESMWQVHDHQANSTNAMALLNNENDENGEENKNEKDDKQITALLVKFRNPMGLMMIPRSVNTNTKMQAALPSIEINRLFSMMGVGIDTLKWIAYLIILVSAISVFVSLYNSLKERKYEMALMLSLGATRTKLFVMLLLEGLIIGLLGYAIGIIFSRIGLLIMSQNAEKNYHYQFNVLSANIEDLYLLLACLIIGIIAAAIPSIRIYKINISKTLADQ
jgi:putative ABC transport system permease protein